MSALSATEAVDRRFDAGALPGCAIELPDACIRYCPQWLDSAAADQALMALLDEIEYTQHEVRMFGRVLPAPRLSAWIGDPGASYRYSRVRHQPLPWTPRLLKIRQRLERDLGRPFNSVLVNRYRDGNDSMGWHADDEPELGVDPVIASVSLGAVRTLHFRSSPPGANKFRMELHHGSLLLMAGRTQACYQHAIHKTRAVLAERINLTFRQIMMA